MTSHVGQHISRSVRHAPASPARAPLIERSSQGLIVPRTSPLDALAGARRVLVVADIENWVYSCRDLGMHLVFEALAQRVRESLNRVDLHAVFSVTSQQASVTEQLAAKLGWTAHSRSIINKRNRRLANADNVFAFVVALLLARTGADALILGTGDGALGLDLARAVRHEFPNCHTIATLSVAGSTSHLLNARNASEIDVNLEIGRDVMRPLS